MICTVMRTVINKKERRLLQATSDDLALQSKRAAVGEEEDGEEEAGLDVLSIHTGLQPPVPSPLFFQLPRGLFLNPPWQHDPESELR